MAATRKERIAKLYLVMSKIYGHLFTSVNKTEVDKSTDFLRIENDVPTKKDWRDIAAIDYQKNHPEIKNIPVTESDKKKMLSMSLLKIKHSQNDKPKKKNTYNDTEYLNKKKEYENNERLD